MTKEPGGSVRDRVAYIPIHKRPRLHLPGGVAADDAFPVEPGGARVISVTGDTAGEVSALNLEGRVPIR